MMGASACAQSAPSPTEAVMVKTVDAATPGAVELLEKLVDINSGTMNLAGVVRVKDVIAPQLEALGFAVRWNPMAQVGRSILVRWGRESVASGCF